MVIKARPENPIVKPIENLEELLLDMGLRLRISIEVLGNKRWWEIRTKKRIGIGDTRESAVADLIYQLRIQLTFDDPNNQVARWGKPAKAYGKNVWLEGIGWGGVSEIKGWRNSPWPFE